MLYIFQKVIKNLKWNKIISIVMIIEIVIGMSTFVYSLNLFYSLNKEEAALKQSKRDLRLEITVEENDYITDTPITLEDYRKIQEITHGKGYIYILIPQFYLIEENEYEFQMLLVDYEKVGLEKGYAYWGNDIQNYISKGIHPISELKIQSLPDYLGEECVKTENTEIELKRSMLASITYMDYLQDQITPSSVYMEWSSDDINNEMKKEIEIYLEQVHGEHFNYRIYSPELELINNSTQVKTTIQTINKTGILFLMIFFIGIWSVYQLLFERRKESYGISMACGANSKKIFLELLLEITILNIIGTIIGLVIGFLLTYFIDFGIMIGYIKVLGDLKTILLSVGICIVMTICIAVTIHSKITKSKITNLLNS